MLEVISIQSLGVAEDGGRFLERNAMLSQIPSGFAHSRNQAGTEIIFLNG